MTDTNIEKLKELHNKQKDLDNELDRVRYDAMIKRAKVLLSDKNWVELVQAIVDIDDEQDKLEGDIKIEKLKLSIAMDRLLYAD